MSLIFSFFPTPSCPMVRQRPGEAYKLQCLAPTVKFGRWPRDASARLEWCKMHDLSHVQVILEEKLVPCALRIFPKSEDWGFYQDNGPCYTVRSVKVWMEDQRIKSQSRPNLNTWALLKHLEHDVIKRRIDDHKPSNKSELIECFAPGVV